MIELTRERLELLILTVMREVTSSPAGEIDGPPAVDATDYASRKASEFMADIAFNDEFSLRVGYLRHLSKIAVDDVKTLITKDQEYGSSWKKRGGVGAFMMLARKWDRLEKQVAPVYDILAAMLSDRRQDGIADDVADLRRYLMLVEAEVRERKGARSSEETCAHGIHEMSFCSDCNEHNGDVTAG
jgi:hypothetical protein